MANKLNTVSGNADVNQQGVAKGVEELNGYSNMNKNRPVSPECPRQSQTEPQQRYSALPTDGTLRSLSLSTQIR